MATNEERIEQLEKRVALITEMVGSMSKSMAKLGDLLFDLNNRLQSKELDVVKGQRDLLS